MPQDNPRGIGRKATEQEIPVSGKSWFLGIGINEYLRWPRLHNAVKDVQDIGRLLQQQYDIEELRIIPGSEATRARIIAALDELVRRVGPEDKLLIYYSGHGHLDTDTGRGFWVPVDADEESTSQYIRNSTIKDYLQDFKSKHTLLLSDACFSGSLFVGGVSRGEERAVADLARWRSRWAMCSGRHNEQVYDGEPGTNSPFAESILKVLKSNHQGYLNAGLLADQVFKMTRNQYDQRPRSGPIQFVGDEGGQYIFRLQRGEEKAYEAAQTQDKVAAYSAFLRAYPHSHYANAALSRIDALEEEQAWEKAQRQGRLSAYHRYLHAYPSGKFAEEARRAIEGLEQEATVPPAEVPQEAVVIPSRQAPAKRPQTAANSFTDPRDGRTYPTVQLNGLTWMAENLDFDVGEGCWYYEKSTGFLGLGGKEQMKDYGRLYTWEAAQRACPPGWRLPTDAEWRAMAKIFGGVDDDASDGGKAAYKALIDGGESDFSARLGGHRYSHGSFYNLGRFGGYWSATEYDSGLAWYYFFDSNNEELGRFNLDKSAGLSCRCIQGS